MTTVEKGNALEDKFYEYLLNQQASNKLVYDAYPPELCKIYKKKSYFCKDREADVEFDVVVELFRTESDTPHMRIIFECKNYSGSIPETEVRDFTDKIGTIFPNSVKGILVVSSPLQSGAYNTAKNRGVGIVKYNDKGFETTLERTAETSFIRDGIFENISKTKSLKFSAYCEGAFCSSVSEFFQILASDTRSDNRDTNKTVENISVPYMTQSDLEKSAEEALEAVDFKDAPVDLEKICALLSIKFHYIQSREFDMEGNEVLGFANFDKKEIHIHYHENKHRERFTLAHEIGHFYLGHDKFLRSETFIEKDLVITDVTEGTPNYGRLEAQANNFASYLLLPRYSFELKTQELRNKFDIKDRGFGYIYVDNQPCNYLPYNMLLSELADTFGASKTVIQIRLKKMNWLTDNRTQ